MLYLYFRIKGHKATIIKNITMKTTVNNNKAIATEILNQLGGNKFLVMTGTKNLIAIDSGLTMKLRRNRSKANYLEIKLNGMDLYDVKFIKFSPSKGTRQIMKSFDNVYNDMLVNIFEKETGYDTSL